MAACGKGGYHPVGACLEQSLVGAGTARAGIDLQIMVEVSGREDDEDIVGVLIHHRNQPLGPLDAGGRQVFLLRGVAEKMQNAPLAKPDHQ